ncbi:MAG: Rrf2 family transcriptional regulator [Candidatus Omnitrophica bacterium]|nr:Rrf2 family transcriptional regulator [Candidatus Omnitrophota bacterium]
MKLITRDTDYAIRALCFIAGSKDKTLSAGRMVRELKVPRPFLRKILQKLNKTGLLRSRKGSGGGFSLSAQADKILLTDLIRAFQGDLKLNDCYLKKKPCPDRQTCPFKKKIDAIEKYVVARLSSITIGGLIREKKGYKKHGVRSRS